MWQFMMTRDGCKDFLPWRGGTHSQKSFNKDEKKVEKSKALYDDARRLQGLLSLAHVCAAGTLKSPLYSSLIQ
jgi:hypothetical protein